MYYCREGVFSLDMGTFAVRVVVVVEVVVEEVVVVVVVVVVVRRRAAAAAVVVVEEQSSRATYIHTSKEKPILAPSHGVASPASRRDTGLGR